MIICYSTLLFLKDQRKSSYHGIMGQPSVSLMQDGCGSKLEETLKFAFLRGFDCLIERQKE